MSRPRLFVSAVSSELRTVRQRVAASVRTLGFDPVSQDDFPTGHGELRQWLREQIDTCEGVIQIIGQGYGAEPREVDADYGRVSYTQFELLYASRQRKKTWLVIAGEQVQRDTPLERLDLLAGDADDPGPADHQTQRRQLKHDYIARLKAETTSTTWPAMTRCWKTSCCSCMMSWVSCAPNRRHGSSTQRRSFQGWSRQPGLAPKKSAPICT